MKLDSAGFEGVLPHDLDAKKLVIDLRDVTWVYPDGVMALYLLLKYRSNKSAATFVYLPVNSDITSYMERMSCFFGLDACVQFDQDINEFLGHAWHEKHSMHQLIPVTHRTEVRSLVDKFVASIDEQRQISDQQKLDLTSCMVELFQNMPDHANPSDPDDFVGFIALQSYQDRDRIYLSIGDLGVGIRNSLMTRDIYKFHRWKDEHAIHAVMSKRMSRFGDIDHSRGGGIRRAVDSVSRLGGSILIRSGCGAVLHQHNEEFIMSSFLKFFPGTQIRVVLLRFVRK